MEIIPNPWTDQSIMSRTRSLLEEVGQVPVTVKREIDGFALNRMQYALVNEAWRLVAVSISETLSLAVTVLCGSHFL